MAEGPDYDPTKDRLMQRIRAFRVEFFLWLIGFVGVGICVQDALYDPPPDLKTMILGGFFAGYIPLTIVAEMIAKWK